MGRSTSWVGYAVRRESEGSRMYVELVLNVVEVLAGAGPKLVRGIEVEAGGDDQVGEIVRGDITGPGGVVAGGAGRLHGG